MGQALDFVRELKQGRATVVPVIKKVSSDDKGLKPIIDSELVDETIQSEQWLYSLTALAPQVSNNHEILIRSLDIVGSVVILILATPAALVVSLLIKIFSPGRILYKQKRVGKNGKIFTLYKFRTMINNSEEHTGPVLAAEDDPRVTLIGRLLRRTRLDELPQLVNILQGDMSLVGPRPERPYFVKRHEELQGTRLAVRPGLTGFAQIRNVYNLRPAHKIKYDHLYIKKRSLLLNLYILVKTMPIIFSKNGW